MLEAASKILQRCAATSAVLVMFGINNENSDLVVWKMRHTHNMSPYSKFLLQIFLYHLFPIRTFWFELVYKCSLHSTFYWVKMPLRSEKTTCQAVDQTSKTKRSQYYFSFVYVLRICCSECFARSHGGFGAWSMISCSESSYDGPPMYFARSTSRR